MKSFTQIVAALFFFIWTVFASAAQMALFDGNVYIQYTDADQAAGFRNQLQREINFACAGGLVLFSPSKGQIGAELGPMEKTIIFRGAASLSGEKGISIGLISQCSGEAINHLNFSGFEHSPYGVRWSIDQPVVQGLTSTTFSYGKGGSVPVVTPTTPITPTTPTTPVTTTPSAMAQPVLESSDGCDWKHNASQAVRCGSATMRVRGSATAGAKECNLFFNGTALSRNGVTDGGETVKYGFFAAVAGTSGNFKLTCTDASGSVKEDSVVYQ